MQVSQPDAMAALSKRLYRFQKQGANFLHEKDVAILADQMGLGKTITALAAIRPDEGAVVVCPAFLMLNWAREAKLFRPDLKVTIDPDLHHSLPRPGEVFVSAYSRLPIAENEGDPNQFPRWAGADVAHPFTLILDEAHYVKSSKSQRSTRVRVLAQIARRVWALTGTPMINEPPELWALLQGCSYSAKKVFGSWENFVRLFGGRKLHFGGYAWNGVVDLEVPALLAHVMLRRTRVEVLPQLPTKTHRDLFVTLSKTSRTSGDFKFIDSWSDAKVEDEATKPAGALFSVRRELADAKHEALDDLIDDFESAREPVVVFGMHAAPIQALGLRKGWAAITGATPLEGRESFIRRFQDPTLALPGIAGTVGAMGVGVTLTRAAHAIFVDRPWTPAEEDQAEDRICRIGQDRPTLITRLIADHPVDVRVQGMLDRKRKLLAKVGL
jgi:SNF2 family DNA or RNA helicase